MSELPVTPGNIQKCAETNIRKSGHLLPAFFMCDADGSTHLIVPQEYPVSEEIKEQFIETTLNFFENNMIHKIFVLSEMGPKDTAYSIIEITKGDIDIKKFLIKKKQDKVIFTETDADSEINIFGINLTTLQDKLQTALH